MATSLTLSPASAILSRSFICEETPEQVKTSQFGRTQSSGYALQMSPATFQAPDLGVSGNNTPIRLADNIPTVSVIRRRRVSVRPRKPQSRGAACPAGSSIIRSANELRFRLTRIRSRASSYRKTRSSRSNRLCRRPLETKLVANPRSQDLRIMVHGSLRYSLASVPLACHRKRHSLCRDVRRNQDNLARLEVTIV